jgi:ribonuclease P protein component
MALPKELRLEREEIREILKNGKKAKIKFLVFQFRESNLKNSKFAIMVSLKVSKKAVVRNKIRRRISEILREIAKKLKKQLEIVVITLPGIENLSFSELKESIEIFFKDIGAL